MSRPEALWRIGRPIAARVGAVGSGRAGMVEVEFHWSGQQQRVRSGVLFEPNEEAKRLLGYADRFVSITPARPRPPSLRLSALHFHRCLAFASTARRLATCST